MEARKQLGYLMGILVLALALTAGLATAASACTSTFLKAFGDPKGSGVLRSPHDVEIDSEGNAWVADTENNRVQKFNAAGEYVTQFSTGLAPAGIDRDAGGDIWVVGGTQVREYSPSGELKLSFGSSGSGNGQFGVAMDLALDPSGNVWVVEMDSSGWEEFGIGKNRVQKFNSKGEYLSQFGKEGAGNGEFLRPQSIAADSEGNILVADTGNNRIQRFSAKGGYLSQFGSSGSGNSQFRFPRGVTVSGSNLWIADTGNGRVQKLKLTGEFVQKFGINGYGHGFLQGPHDLAIDLEGAAWIGNSRNSSVQRFDSSGGFVSQFGTESQTGGVALDSEGDIWITSFHEVHQYKPSGELIFSFGSFGLGNGQFGEAVDLAIDPSGNVWVLEKPGYLGGAHRVQKFNSNGEFLLKFGKEGTGNGEFKSPEAIAADSEGNILVADTGNHRYQEFTSAGEFVRKVGSEGTGNGQFKSPRGIAADSSGNVWVVDSGNNRLQRFSAKGAYLNQFGSSGSGNGQFKEPRGVAVSGSNIWVADTGNERVQKFSCI